MVSVGILNETNVDNGHFGCIRVMDCIYDRLQERGIRVSVAVPSGLDWRSEAEYVTGLSSSNLILVNGEGTLHHGRRKGRWLLEIAEAEELVGIPKVLVNAVWQGNPADWGKLLRQFDLVTTRDSWSANEASESIGRDVEWLPDLSVFSPVASSSTQARSGIIIGDSASNAASIALAELGKSLENAGRDVVLAPVVTKDHGTHRQTGWRRLRLKLRNWRLHSAQRGLSSVSFNTNVEEYLEALAGASLNINGRFHAICLSLVTRTPFIAFTSNSWKIEALIEDVGLDRDRLKARGEFGPKDLERRDWKFSDRELENIDEFLARSHIGIPQLFDEVERLALENERQVGPEKSV